MSTLESVDYAAADGIATITLNRPKSLNAFEDTLRRDLLEAISQANADNSIRIVILTGAGRGFSAGHDLANGNGAYDTIEELIVTEYKPIIMAINDADKLYIAAVNGPCAGIGAAMAMTCDLVIMADDAYIYQAFAAIGLVPDGGTSQFLLNAMGYRKALQTIIEAEKIPAGDCLGFGLANRVVTADALMSEAKDWALRLAAGSPIAQKNSKRLLKTAARSNLSEIIDAEAKAQLNASLSEDYKNAAEAFFRKEKPVFSGR